MYSSHSISLFKCTASNFSPIIYTLYRDFGILKRLEISDLHIKYQRWIVNIWINYYYDSSVHNKNN